MCVCVQCDLHMLINEYIQINNIYVYDTILYTILIHMMYYRVEMIISYTADSFIVLIILQLS